MGHRVLFVVETGWKGMREASLAFIKNGVFIDIAIKGSVNKEVLDIIARPDKTYRIMALPRLFFRVYLFFYFFWHKMLRDLKRVIVSKERTKYWIRSFGFDTKLLIETEKGYELVN